MATGQIVRRLVRRIGFTMMPVMFATASTPESASTMWTKLVQWVPIPARGTVTFASPRCGTAKAATTR